MSVLQEHRSEIPYVGTSDSLDSESGLRARAPQPDVLVRRVVSGAGTFGTVLQRGAALYSGDWGYIYCIYPQTFPKFCFWTRLYIIIYIPRLFQNFANFDPKSIIFLIFLKNFRACGASLYISPVYIYPQTFPEFCFWTRVYIYYIYPQYIYILYIPSHHCSSETWIYYPHKEFWTVDLPGLYRWTHVL